MLEKQIHGLGTIWRDKDIRTYAKDGAINLIKWIVFDDVQSGLATTEDAAKIIQHTPTILYWDKMFRYMSGVFIDGEARIKLGEKFEKDNPKYYLFVKKQMHIINELSDDEKIDFFAQLTRCYLFTELSDELYMKLAKFLSMCTPSELVFLKELPVNAVLGNTMMASALAQYGLLTQKVMEDGSIAFVVSDFGRSLKHNSLNFDDGIQGQKRLLSYEMMTPPELTQYATNDDVDKMLQNQQLLEDQISQNRQWGDF